MRRELQRAACAAAMGEASRPRGMVIIFLLLFGILSPVPASAHIGPPFPIIENRKVGSCTIALWTHPDVGTGTFFVFVDPPPGGKVPGDLKIQIGVQPESHRLPEVVYATDRDDSHEPVQFKSSVQFDHDEFWRVHVLMQSSQCGGEEFSRVEATPTGFGRWDLLFFLLPFLAVAFLWFKGISRQRRRKKQLQVV